MNTIQYPDDELGPLFRQLPVEKPSADFQSHVMAQVMLEAEHVAEKRRVRRLAWAISIPGSMIVLLVTGFLVNRYYGLDILRYFEPLLTSLNDTFLTTTKLFSGNAGSHAIVFGIIVLALLLGDLFIRRSVERKKCMTHHLS